MYQQTIFGLVFGLTLISTLMRSYHIGHITYSHFLRHLPVTGISALLGSKVVHILMPVTDNCPTWVKGCAHSHASN